MKTKAVNLYKEKYDVYIGRAGKGQDGYFGNPFQIGADGDRAEVLKKYRKYFYEKISMDKEFKRRVHELKGRTLGCFCKPQSCHGDIIAEYLNGLPEDVEA